MVITLKSQKKIMPMHFETLLKKWIAAAAVAMKEKAKKIEWGDALKAARYVSVNVSLENY